MKTPAALARVAGAIAAGLAETGMYWSASSRPCRDYLGLLIRSGWTPDPWTAAVLDDNSSDADTDTPGDDAEAYEDNPGDTPDQDPGDILEQIRTIPDMEVARTFIHPPAHVSRTNPYVLALGDVVASGNLKSLNARTGDLFGTMYASGSIGKVVLGNVTGMVVAAWAPANSISAALTDTHAQATVDRLTGVANRPALLAAAMPGGRAREDRVPGEQRDPGSPHGPGPVRGAHGRRADVPEYGRGWGTACREEPGSEAPHSPRQTVDQPGPAPDVPPEVWPRSTSSPFQPSVAIKSRA